MAFNHEHPEVYPRTWPFNVKVGVWTVQWDSKHALCDQLSRAAGSMLESIAVASAAYSTMKRRGLDYAIGSSLECAACLDLAGIKPWLDMKSLHTEKEELSQILRMLVGLKRSWAQSGSVVREDWAEYVVGDAAADITDKARDKARDKEESPENPGRTEDERIQTYGC
jgi:four helix bundle protein